MFGQKVAASDNDKSEEAESDEGPDVVVETAEVDDTQSASIAAPAGARRKVRRGRRGSKQGAKNEKAYTGDLMPGVPPTGQPSSPPVEIATRPFVKRPPKVPLVEYSVETVLSHSEAAQFVQRTARVVNILEFKHSRVAAGKHLLTLLII
jgi:hypothetical protein